MQDSLTHGTQDCAEELTATPGAQHDQGGIVTCIEDRVDGRTLDDVLVHDHSGMQFAQSGERLCEDTLLAGTQFLDVYGRRAARCREHVVGRDFPRVHRKDPPAAPVGDVEGEVERGKRQLRTVDADDDGGRGRRGGLAHDDGGALGVACHLHAYGSDEQPAEAAHATAPDDDHVGVGTGLDQHGGRTAERDLDVDDETGMRLARLVGSGLGGLLQPPEQIIDRVGREDGAAEAHALHGDSGRRGEGEHHAAGHRFRGRPIDGDARVLGTVVPHHHARAHGRPPSAPGSSMRYPAP